MTGGEGFSAADLQALREEEPEGLLDVASIIYALRVENGAKPDEAMLDLIDLLARNGINLPEVMKEHPDTTDELFGFAPDFDASLVDDVQWQIDNG